MNPSPANETAMGKVPQVIFCCTAMVPRSMAVDVPAPLFAVNALFAEGTTAMSMGEPVTGMLVSTTVFSMSMTDTELPAVLVTSALLLSAVKLTLVGKTPTGIMASMEPSLVFNRETWVLRFCTMQISLPS